MLSLSSQIAIKAVIFLASKMDSGQKTGIREIAGFIDASVHTVGKLLQILVRQNIICSTKGPSGGFYITSRQYHLPLVRVIEAIDGKAVFSTCGLGLRKCSSENPCPIHHDFKRVRERFEKIYRENTVADLCESVKTGLTHLSLKPKRTRSRKS